MIEDPLKELYKFNHVPCIIFCGAPGVGKTSTVKKLLDKYPDCEFSVSGTNRGPRGNEIHGKDYWFYKPEEFMQRLRSHQFMENVDEERSSSGSRYGTLVRVMLEILKKGKIPALDVDLNGGIDCKKIFPKSLLFYLYSSSEVREGRMLKRFLEKEGREPNEKEYENIRERIQRGETEYAISETGVYGSFINKRIKNEEITEDQLFKIADADIMKIIKKHRKYIKSKPAMSISELSGI